MDQLRERERILELREVAVLKHAAALKLIFDRMVKQIHEENERFSRQQRNQQTSTSEVSADYVARHTSHADPGPPYSADNLPPWYR
jgi:hypothetical protein